MPEAALQLVNAMPNAQFAAMDAPTHELSPEDIVPLLAGFLTGRQLDEDQADND